MRKVVSVLLMICMLFGATYQGQVVKGASKEKVIKCDGFEVRYEISSIWNNGYIGNVYITNTGKETIENWELSYQSVD